MDTGSELSILPPGRAKATRPNHQPLVAANGSPIKSFGTRQIELQLGLQNYSWRFIVAEVTQPIIGGDFLRSHSLLVDLANERLIRTDNLKIIKGSRSLQGSLQIASLVSSDKFMSILRKRPGLTTPVSRVHYQSTEFNIASPLLDSRFIPKRDAFHQRSSRSQKKNSIH